MKLRWIIIVLVLALSYYLISPLFSSTVVNDTSPLAHMDAAMKAEFDAEMDKMKDEVMVMSDQMPIDRKLLKMADFKPKAHEVDGKALLIKDGVDTVLRFENFKTINGPNLHIYLSADLNGNDFVDLGKIKATEGNVNYAVDSSVDLEKYNKVLVWCVPFKVLFSYAELS